MIRQTVEKVRNIMDHMSIMSEPHVEEVVSRRCLGRDGANIIVIVSRHRPLLYFAFSFLMNR